MKQITKYIGLVAILSVAWSITISADSIDEAAAQPAEGKPGGLSGPQSYGSATDDIVCGASLCSTPEGSEDPVNVGRAN